METTATQAAFYLPLLRYIIGTICLTSFTIATIGIIYLAAILFPYAKDR